ncbi:unnamed protein product, partial [Durusdinium trenchii]
VIETKEEAFFRALTFRQRYIATYESAARSTVQTIFEIASLKATYEETHTACLSRSDLAELWSKKTQDLGPEDDCPKSAFEFVDSAMKIHERMLSNENAFDVIFCLEERFGKLSCFQHMSVLEAVCMKTKKIDEMLWILHSIEDMLMRGEAELEEVRDEFLAKKGLLKYLVEESQNWGLPAAEANSVMETMRSHRQVIKEEIDKMRRAQKQGVEGEESQGARDKTGIFVHELLPDLSLSVDEDDDETAQKLISYAKEAEQLVDQFVRLVVEQDSMQGIGPDLGIAEVGPSLAQRMLFVSWMEGDSCLLWCSVLPYDQEQGCWIVSKEEKDKIYGTAGKVLAGGALPDCPDRPDLGADRFPVNYHTMPQGFFAELFHSLAASLMVNGTEIDGKGAEAAILAKKSYIGICFTDFHAIELRKLLVRFVWEHFQDQSSAYYKVELQTLLKKATGGAPPRPAPPAPTSKGRGSGKGGKGGGKGGKGGKGGPKPKPQPKRPSEEEAEQENKKPKKEEILEKLKALQGGSGGALMEDDDDEPLDED